MAQATQGLLGERRERLAASDRGVIVLRQIVRRAIESTLRGEQPPGVLPPARDGLVRFDSYVGLRMTDAAGEAKRDKNRNHPDLRPMDGDVEREVQRLIGLGARPADVGQTGQEGFVVLADPEGNEFCVLRREPRRV